MMSSPRNMVREYVLQKQTKGNAKDKGNKKLIQKQSKI